MRRRVFDAQGFIDAYPPTTAVCDIPTWWCTLFNCVYICVCHHTNMCVYYCVCVVNFNKQLMCVGDGSDIDIRGISHPAEETTHSSTVLSSVYSLGESHLIREYNGPIAVRQHIMCSIWEHIRNASRTLVFYPFIRVCVCVCPHIVNNSTSKANTHMCVCVLSARRGGSHIAST